jgi:hypothetical protein
LWKSGLKNFTYLRKLNLSLCVILHLMKAQSLVNTNPYLKDADNRQRLVARSVRTSCGVEGIREKTGKSQVFNVPSRGEKKIYKNTFK